MKLKITFYGAAGEVGRSCIMVESNDTRILLDAGIKLGEHTEYPLLPDSELATIDGIVISHAHLDHSGYLPHIYTAGYKGYTYTIKPTFELTNVLISDYVRISNPENIKREGILKMTKMHKLVEYHEEFRIKNLSYHAVHVYGHLLEYARSHVIVKQQRSRIMEGKESSIIVTTSGMITGGPIMKYLERCRAACACRH